MIDLIYDFVRYTLIGNTTITGADDLAVLISFAIILLISFVLIKLVVWCFNLGAGRRKTRF